VSLPGLILTPTMVGARALATVFAPLSWVQARAGSTLTVSQRLLRWSATLPTARPSVQASIVVAVLLGLVIAPILIVLGAAAAIVVAGRKGS